MSFPKAPTTAGSFPEIVSGDDIKRHTALKTMNGARLNLWLSALPPLARGSRLRPAPGGKVIPYAYKRRWSSPAGLIIRLQLPSSMYIKEARPSRWHSIRKFEEEPVWRIRHGRCH